MPITWWRHQIETFSALLVLCAGNSPSTIEFSSQRPVTRSFGVFFNLHLNKRLSKNPRQRWFEMPLCSLWRHCNDELIASRVGVLSQFPMMTSSNGNIFRVTGPLCGEFTGPGEFPTQRPVTRSFDVLFDLRLNKRLSKQPWGWWFETPSWSLWRQRNAPFHYSPNFSA